jgi:hypothetical protein
MKDSENQQKFIDLRLQGVSIPKVADKLGISLSTAKRWNRTYKDDILSIKNEELMNNKKIFFAKYDEMSEFLDSHLTRLKDHLQNNNEIFMSYEKTLLASLKIIDALNKIQSLKKMISESNHADLLNSFSLFKNPGDDLESVPENQSAANNDQSTRHYAQSTNDSALNTNNSTLNTKDSAPSSTHNAPCTIEDSLNTNNSTLKTKNSTPKTNDSAPCTTHNAPSTKDDALKTKNSTLKTKNSTLEKKKPKQIIGINYHPVNDTPGVTSETQNNHELNTASDTK